MEHRQTSNPPFSRATRRRPSIFSMESEDSVFSAPTLPNPSAMPTAPSAMPTASPIPTSTPTLTLTPTLSSTSTPTLTSTSTPTPIPSPMSMPVSTTFKTSLFVAPLPDSAKAKVQAKLSFHSPSFPSSPAPLTPLTSSSSPQLSIGLQNLAQILATPPKCPSGTYTTSADNIPHVPSTVPFSNQAIARFKQNLSTLREAKKALDRWNSMPESAIKFLESHMILVCTLSSESKFSETLVRLYTEIGCADLMLYHLLFGEIAAHLNGPHSLFEEESMAKKYLWCYIRQQKPMQSFFSAFCSPAIALCENQMDDSITRSERLVCLREMVRLATENIKLLPAALSKTLSLLRLRLKEIYPLCQRLVGYAITLLLLTPVLANPLSFGMKFPESIEFQRAATLFRTLADDLAQVSRDYLASFNHVSNSNERRLAAELMNLSCAILKEHTEEEQGVLSYNSLQSLIPALSDIGRFLVSIKMFRSAFCECHFTMRMPVHLWNASMLSEYVSVTGFPQYAEEFQMYNITGKDALHFAFNSHRFPFPCKLGHRKKILKQLLSLEDVYCAPLASGSDPVVWSISTVCCWLSDMGYQQYSQIFYNNRVDGGRLRLLSGTELKLMGVKDAEDRNSLLGFIRHLFEYHCPVGKDEMTFCEDGEDSKKTTRDSNASCTTNAMDVSLSAVCSDFGKSSSFVLSSDCDSSDFHCFNARSFVEPSTPCTCWDENL